MKTADNVQFTFQSCSDLNEIWEGIAMPRHLWGSAASEDISTAETFAQEVERVCALLPQHPEISSNRDDLLPGVRSVLFNKYVIFYRMRGPGVEVLRVLRATSDINAGIIA